MVGIVNIFRRYQSVGIENLAVLSMFETMQELIEEKMQNEVSDEDVESET